jgi:hypothetical protein
LTLSEQLGLTTKADRIAFGGLGGGGHTNQLFSQRAKDNPFQKLDQFVNLSRPPKVQFNDLKGIAESDLPKPSFDVLGSLKVIPNATAEFKQDQTLGIYMQVYNVGADQATLRPSVDIEYVISQ